MSAIINFRKPDPYVEVDGVRKPLSDYPNIKILRGDEPIPGLREVNLQTGWLTLGAPGVYQPWLANPATPDGEEWQETVSNLRVEGVPELGPLCITGIDMRLARRQSVAVRTSAPLTPAKTPRKAAKPEKPDPRTWVSKVSEEERRAALEALAPPKPPPDAVDFMEFAE